MIKRILVAIFVIALISVAGYFIIISIIQKKIKQQFASISPAMQIKFASVRANILSSSVSFDSLDITFTPFSSRPGNKHHAYFPTASINHISFLKFLFGKKLEANAVSLGKGSVQLDEFLLEKKDSLQPEILNRVKWPFKQLNIGQIEMQSSIFLHTDSGSHLIGRAQMALGKIYFNPSGSNHGFHDINIQLSDVNYPRYGIQISQLMLNSNNKTLELDSLEFAPPRRKENKIIISSIKMTGFDVLKLLNERALIARSVVMGDSKIALAMNEMTSALSIPVEVKKIYINEMQSKATSISLKYQGNNCSLNADIEMSELACDSPLTKKEFHFATLNANLSDVHYSENNYTDVEIKNIVVSSKKELIQLENISIEPRLGKYELERKMGHQADWMRTFISRIEILKPGFDDLLRQKLIADRIRIGEAKVYVFRDRRLPRPEKNIPLPVEYIKTLPFDLRIGTCELASSTVEYEEYPKSGYGLTGILKIENARASVSPLINHPLRTDPAYLTMNVEGSIMGSGTTHGTVLMPLQKNKPYYIKGIFERVDLTTLNSSSENLGKIRIKSGFLDFLFFDFTMTEERSTGKIIGAYHHLIVQPLKKHTKEKNVADLASFGLRHGIIPLNKDTSLPEKKRTGLVNYQRDPTRMVSYYYLQSLLMGVKKSFSLGFLLPK